MARSQIGNLAALAALAMASWGAQSTYPLPGGYYAAMETGLARIQARLGAEPHATLEEIEQAAGWRHFPHAMLAAAALYVNPATGNRSKGDPTKLAAAIRIGDLAAEADERGNYYSRLDSYWDTYMWLEAYRRLEPQLGPQRRARWAAALERNVGHVYERCRAWRDFPAYNCHFLGTSTNHFAQWAVNLMIAGRLFGRTEWRLLGEHILKRLATTEQSPDGYWGEYSQAGPTNGYNLLTLAAVGVYWEYTKDPAALAALRRATDFHTHFSYPDGLPVEVINDRNRYWDLNLYGNFAFTHFDDGRAFAALLWEQFPAARLDMESLGRIAQNALYYHQGPLAPVPQQRAHYAWRLAGPAGIRKTGPWVTALSGLMSTQPAGMRWFLERQANLSVFHQATGLIVSGGNSQAQPELATFWETIHGKAHYLPLWSRLEMGDAGARLWLAFRTFFAEVVAPDPEGSERLLRFIIHGRGPTPENARLALQLCLKEGEELTTGSGLHVRVGRQRLSLSSAQIGGLLSHSGWRLSTSAPASLEWPVFPYNPYRNGPEVQLSRAVAVLSVPLVLKAASADYVRPNQQIIEFNLGFGAPVR